MASTSSNTSARSALVGSTSNFWLYSSDTGWDLTHPSTPDSPPLSKRVTIQTTTQPITIHPPSTAVVVIDMQNFFLSTALGRSPDSLGLAAQTQLLDHAIPAAHEAGIQVIYLNWGLTDEDLEAMPPATIKAFGFYSKSHPGEASESRLENGGKNSRQYVGLGQLLGPVFVPDPSGDAQDLEVQAGRLLFRDTWNASLTPELEAVRKTSEVAARLASKGSTTLEDVVIPKNRLDGLWGGPSNTPFGRFLQERNIKTLLFAGVNTDQCVSSTLTSAFTLGYDCILLRDGSATSSGEAAQQSVEKNCSGTYGFVSTCRWLADGVKAMKP